MNKISILIPVYNERNTLLEILKQVEAVDFGLEKEIILIDDYSTDGTKEYIKICRIKFFIIRKIWVKVRLCALALMLQPVIL